jgi:Tfp pilus assembly PilM family ATPase
MMRTRNPYTRRTVSIEIDSSQLQMAVVRHGAYQAQTEVQCRKLTWQEDREPLHTESSIKKLRTALSQLVAQEQLAGESVNVTLNGDFCVTRVVTGTNEQVHRELGKLEQRSALYLGLGVGPKALATSVRPLDARHQHALMSLTNKKDLEALVRAIDEVGLKVVTVEPSLVALSRVVGHTGRDKDEPVLIINLNRQGVELGISHRGFLLLDYRPSGREVEQQVAEIVNGHLMRLRRYCDRYYRFAEGKIQHVLLFGSNESLTHVHQAFQGQSELEVDILEPGEIDDAWKLQFDRQEGNQVCAALGSCLLQDLPEPQQVTPNLMNRFRLENREPLGRVLLRLGWPIAAAILVALGLFAAIFFEKVQTAELTDGIESLHSATVEAWNNEIRLRRSTEKVRSLNQIRDAVAHPAWDQLISTMGHCLPQEVWLDQVEITSSGKVRIRGTSYGDEPLYEFVRWLNSAPAFQRVDLEATQPTKLGSLSATTFDVLCDLHDHDELEKEGNLGD